MVDYQRTIQTNSIRDQKRPLEDILLIGLIGVMILAPFAEWMIPLSANHRAPLVDLLGIFLFFLWIAGLLLKKISIRLIPRSIFLSFFAFSLIAFVSIFNSLNPSESAWALFRFPLFAFITYFFLPIQIIKTPRQMMFITNATLFIGLFFLMMGFASFIFPAEESGFFRARPLPIFGDYPTGESPNLLADILLPVIPLWLVAAYFSPSQFSKKFSLIIFFLTLSLTLLTFSRAAWVSIAIMTIGVMMAEKKIRMWMRKNGKGFLYFFLPFLAFMVIFSKSHIAFESNANRLRLWDISLSMIRNHPWVGAGIGMFQRVVDADRTYLFDYGSSLDAHGIPQKFLAETGILGFAAFSFFLFFIFLFVWKSARRMKTDRAKRMTMGYGFAALSLVISQQFNTTYFAAKFWLFLGLAMAAALTFFRYETRKN